MIRTFRFHGPESCVNNLVINSQYDIDTVYLLSDVIINGNLTIEQGHLEAWDNTITIAGDWINLVGPTYFIEDTSSVIFSGTNYQYCSHSETFNNLELNNSFGLRIESGAVVNCASYDWTAGTIYVNSGTFTAGDLADNGIYGGWNIGFSGAVNITQDSAGYVDLNGNLTISGIFNVYGGTDTSWWPYTNNASLSMNGGVLDFKDQGIFIALGYDFVETITGGLIRTVGGFQVERTDFNPAAGILELYGGADVSLSLAAGSNLNKLIINKTLERDETEALITTTDRFGHTTPLLRTNTVTSSGTLDLNDDFWLEHGAFIAPATMYVGDDWTNINGETAFTEGSGLVVFDGTGESNIFANETFYNLEMNKTGSGAVSIGVGNTITCSSYNWTAGSLSVSGGTFTALDMADDGIYGTINLTSGRINFHQDTSSYIDLRANVTISGGELHVYGGGADMLWPYVSNASLTMSNGIFDIHDVLVYVFTSGTLTTNITGGTIRVGKGFYCNRADFNPTGGTLEMYSSADANLNMIAGSLYNLNINTAARGADEENPPDRKTLTYGRDGASREETRSNTVTTLHNFSCRNLSVYSGAFNSGGYTLTLSGNLYIYSGGSFNLGTGGILYMNNNKYINVTNGGTFYAYGTSTSSAIVTATGYFNFNVLSGGTIKADYTIFEKMNTSGINISYGATIDPAHAFYGCTFRDGLSTGTLLTLNSGQNLLISNTVFPANTWSGTSNVKKTNDYGVINFANATGAYAGEAFDNDTYNRVLWTTPTAAYDLQIVKAVWDPVTAIIGQTAAVKVTYLNNSLNACGGLYLDLYYDRASAPGFMQGNQYNFFPNTPGGLPQDYTFYVYNDDDGNTGIWNSWLQIDMDDVIPEMNENNNIYGPFIITWVNLPAITDLTIIRLNPTTVKLDWSYPTTCTRFNVYRSTDAYFTPGPGNLLTSVAYPTTEYTEAASGTKYFYIVKAEQVSRTPKTEPAVIPPENQSRRRD